MYARWNIGLAVVGIGELMFLAVITVLGFLIEIVINYINNIIIFSCYFPPLKFYMKYFQ